MEVTSNTGITQAQLDHCYYGLPPTREHISIPKPAWWIIIMSQMILNKVGSIALLLWGSATTAVRGGGSALALIRSTYHSAQRALSSPPSVLGTVVQLVHPSTVSMPSSSVALSLAQDNSMGLFLIIAAILNLMFIFSTFVLSSLGIGLGLQPNEGFQCDMSPAYWSADKITCGSPKFRVEPTPVAPLDLYEALFQQKLSYYYPVLFNASRWLEEGHLGLEGSYLSILLTFLEGPLSMVASYISAAGILVSPKHRYNIGWDRGHDGDPTCGYRYVDTNSVLSLWWALLLALSLLAACLVLYALCRLVVGDAGIMSGDTVKELAALSQAHDPPAPHSSILASITSLNATNDDMARLWWDRTHLSTFSTEDNAAETGLAVVAEAEMIKGFDEVDSTHFSVSASLLGGDTRPSTSEASVHATAATSVASASEVPNTVLRWAIAAVFGSTAILLTFIVAIWAPTVIVLIVVIPVTMFSKMRGIANLTSILPNTKRDGTPHKPAKEPAQSPLSVQYCKACRTHVEGFDHHCSLVGACIGGHNFGFFLLLLHSLVLCVGVCIGAFSSSYLLWRPLSYSSRAEGAQSDRSRSMSAEGLGCAALLQSRHDVPVMGKPIWLRGTAIWGAPWPSLDESLAIAALLNGKQLVNKEAASQPSPYLAHSHTLGSYRDYYRAIQEEYFDAKGLMEKFLLVVSAIKHCIMAAVVTTPSEVIWPMLGTLLQIYATAYVSVLAVNYSVLFYLQRQSVLLRREEFVCDQQVGKVSSAYADYYAAARHRMVGRLGGYMFQGDGEWAPASENSSSSSNPHQRNDSQVGALIGMSKGILAIAMWVVAVPIRVFTGQRGPPPRQLREFLTYMWATLNYLWWCIKRPCLGLVDSKTHRGYW